MTERNDEFDLSATADPREHLVSRLGILGVSLNPQIADALSVQRVNSGIVVASTVQNAIDARDGGLAAGDVIYAINRTPVQSSRPYGRQSMPSSRAIRLSFTSSGAVS